MPLPEAHKRYVYRDYLTWPEEQRWELIDGIAYQQAAPTWQHQSVVGELLTQFRTYLRGKECQVFAAPFDLRLSNTAAKDEEVATVIQPDLLVVCDKSRLKGTGYLGVPPLVIEVISPASSKMDRLYKFNKYEQAGVREYWLVEPEGKLVSVFTLQINQRYGRPEIYSEEDEIPVGIFRELRISLKEVFEF